ncbi:bifunctional folylpolyglutamate synthase/dihydrofolate synthase [Pseudalkalibacillus hwajinpoensis]|uniref:bifunctional folylpolyglutamate synthase/dihydrofolate synthase n=1 Tax=Guptibacillus hwajinpoensis TaxID=208199 RepID=UPI001CD77FBF|nr:hypothetical protein [Pseudalkalibacillus hwajinpoensis]
MEIRTQKEAEDLIYQSYLRAINNISESLDEKVKKPELTRKLLDLIGSPDRGQKYILVTGSKGKGSTSRFISSLLAHLGYKVGLFTSPHLVNFNERIRINGKAISEKDFVRISNLIEPQVSKIEKDLNSDQYQGPVGIALSTAVTYFKENKTDINVIEIGRGGLYDDTNVLENDWAVITPIMKEHTNSLGSSINEIVIHKLGIIKKNTKSVYISRQENEVMAQIQNSHLLKNTKNRYYKEDFLANNIEMTEKGTSFEVNTKRDKYSNLSIPLLGEFQAINAAVAIQFCEDFVGGKIDQSIVNKCFSSIQWPGRSEIVSHNPTVIVDGAINEFSANYLKNVIKVIGSDCRIASIIGVPKDKDYRGVINVLNDVSNQMILTKPDVSHLIFPEDALKYAKSLNANSLEFPYLNDSLKYAKDVLKADLILIVGTQTLIGNAKRIMGHSLLDIGK